MYRSMHGHLSSKVVCSGPAGLPGVGENCNVDAMASSRLYFASKLQIETKTASTLTLACILAVFHSGQTWRRR